MTERKVVEERSGGPHVKRRPKPMDTEAAKTLVGEKVAGVATDFGTNDLSALLCIAMATSTDGEVVAIQTCGSRRQVQKMLAHVLLTLPEDVRDSVLAYVKAPPPFRELLDFLGDTLDDFNNERASREEREREKSDSDDDDDETEAQPAPPESEPSQ